MENENNDENLLLVSLAVMDRMTDTVLLLTPAGGICYTNNAACQRLGYTRKELLKMRISDITGIETESWWDSQWRELKQLGTVILESRHRRKNGEFFPVEVQTDYIQFDGKEYGCGIARDITDRKQAESELQESREKYRGLSEATFEAIFISERGICIEQNRTAETMFGYTSEEAIGRSGTEWIIPEHREMVMKNMIAGFEDPYEATALKKDGTTFPCVLRGKMMKYKGRDVRVTSLSDITERKNAEAAVIESETRYRTLFQSASDGIFYLSPNLKICEVNESFARMHGYTVDEMRNMRLFDLDTPESSRGTPERLRGVMEGKIMEFEVEHYHKDGHTFPLSVSSNIISIGGQQLIQAFHRDITKSKQAEKEILKLNEDLELRVIQRTTELEAVNKELEAFSYSISHDLKTPLRHIKGYIEVFLDNKSAVLSQEEFGYLNKISNSASEMELLIDAILTFSRLNQAELKKKLVKSHEVVHQVIKFFSPEIQNRKITFKVAALPDVTCDEDLIRQVWTNLISNAIKYTGKVPEAVIEIGSSSTDSETIFFVKDNGAGFDMTDAKKMFGVFQRLHHPSDFEGIGIGLANVHRIVLRHAGHCEAEGEPGKGATFYFSLPK
jgi:PAS domain S-box-containing protein